MSDFINEFLHDKNKAAEEIRRREAREEREKLRSERDKLDYEHKTELARQNAIATRKTTLDIAWAAAELLNQSDARPDHWLYTQRPAGFFGRKALQGIAATGWPLLAWRSTRYTPSIVNRLILTPTSEAASGVHLSYFADELPRRDGPVFELRPQDVYPLPAEPTSEHDMPWPTEWTGGVGDGSIMITSERDDHYEMVRSLSKLATPSSDKKSPSYRVRNRNQAYEIYLENTFDEKERKALREIDEIRQSMAQRALLVKTPYTYERYLRSGSEAAMRRSIAVVAAQHLHIAPEKAARTLARRVKLGIEERSE